MLEDLEVRYPSQQVGISINRWKTACTPGADVHAVIVRISWMRTAKSVSVSSGRTLFELHDGTPHDAMFDVFATGHALEEFRRIMKEFES
jgi:hypothetical protein